MTSIWWEPEPSDGGIVPDHPPIDLTDEISAVTWPADTRRCGLGTRLAADGVAVPCPDSGDGTHWCVLPWVDRTVLRVEVMHRCVCGVEWCS